MSDDSIIASCCGACFVICSLTCCESILVWLNFRKPGSRAGSTQRGCCRDLGESTKDDPFEEEARRKRAVDSSKKHRDQDGNEVEGERGNEPVTEQPVAPPVMTATATTTAVTKPDADVVK